MIEVRHFQRRAGERNFSIERLFNDVRAAMPADITCTCHCSPFPSRGVIPRIRNILDAKRHCSVVNHVTGDVHFLGLGLPGASTILTIHDCGLLHRLRGWQRAVLKFFWFTWPITRCRVVTAVSAATRDELVRLAGASPTKIRVIHNCVSPEFVRVPAEFQTARPVVLLLGTAPNKNLERIAAGLEGISCAVELVGQPTSTQKAAFVRHRIDLTALGDVNDDGILQAYRRCDVVLFASTHEGFGLPILEAQATGRAVITSDCSSMPEVAGGAACLVDPLDPLFIRAGLQRVIRDHSYRERLIELGFRNVERFVPTKIAAEYAILYRQIGAGTRGRS